MRGRDRGRPDVRDGPCDLSEVQIDVRAAERHLTRRLVARYRTALASRASDAVVTGSFRLTGEARFGHVLLLSG
jgi:hypothetical protein